MIVSDKGVSPSGFAFNWDSNSSVIPDIDSDAGTFTFDPVNLTPGNYIFTMIYKDNNLSVPVRSKSEIVLKVVEYLDGDSDDDDNDGIENKKDDESLSGNQLQLIVESNSSLVMTSSAGILKTGKTAFCAGKASFITGSDLENYGSATCAPVTNSVDSNIENYVVSGYFDFEIHGLNVGEQVQVVLPLTSGIPSSASYRKYMSNIGWEEFYVRGDDAVSSSPGLGSGICPSPDSNAYTSGLTEGNTCVRLSITDGGPNDADFSANGVIIDPGTVAVVQSSSQDSLNSSSGCSLRLASHSEKILDHLEWLLILVFLLRTFYICRYSKR